MFGHAGIYVMYASLSDRERSKSAHSAQLFTSVNTPCPRGARWSPARTGEAPVAVGGGVYEWGKNRGIIWSMRQKGGIVKFQKKCFWGGKCSGSEDRNHQCKGVLLCGGR